MPETRENLFIFGTCERLSEGSPHLGPNVIPSDDVALFLSLGMLVEGRLKRGRYGVVFSGSFAAQFDLEAVRNFPHWHTSVFSRGKEPNYLEATGTRFALKHSDIVVRKAYSIEDIEERLNQEVDFFKKFDYKAPGSEAIVRFFFLVATSASRYYMFLERADDNLQCVLADLDTRGKIFSPAAALEIYGTLLVAIRTLHKQNIVYNMLKLSNILVFFDDAPQTSIVDRERNFKVKIADFVKSIDTSRYPHKLIKTAIERDLLDLYHIQYELLKHSFPAQSTPSTRLHTFREQLNRWLVTSSQVPSPGTHSISCLDLAHRATMKYRDELLGRR